MRTNNEMEELLQKIALLKEKKELELELLKVQYEITRENLKPINIIKNSFFEKILTTNIKGNLINMGLGLTTEYLINKIETKPSNNKIIKIINSALKFIKDKMQ